MSVTSFLESVGRILVSNSPSLVAIGLVSYWVKTRLRESIRHEYEKELEEFKSKNSITSKIAASVSK